MDEIETIDILKRCSDKKKERMIKSPVLLLNVAIWSHRTHSWPGLNYICNAKYKTLRYRQIHYNYFTISKTSSILDDLCACVCVCVFIRLDCYMDFGKFTWR